MPHTPGTHGTGHRAPTRRGRPRPPASTARLVTLLLSAPLIGMFLGGAVFVLLCAGAAALAAGRVRPAGLWWVLPAAPLLIWTVCVGRELLDTSGDGAKQAVAVAHGMIDAFPAMVLALTGAALVAVVRRTSGRRGSVRA